MDLADYLTFHLFDSPYLGVFFSVILYFSFLYFIGGIISQKVCVYLESKSILNKIIDQKIPAGQVKREMKYSISSILVFGFIAVLMVYLIRVGFLHLAESNWANLFLGLMVLSLWNEVHFYIVHRLLHLPWLMRRVHYIHHTSNIPTVYSIYSFHWLEAFLLGIVPLVVLWILPLSILSIAFYPILSIIINWIGHANYRFGNAGGAKWMNLSTNHNMHHRLGKKHYAFGLYHLDKVYSFFTSIINPKKN